MQKWKFKGQGIQLSVKPLFIETVERKPMQLSPYDKVVFALQNGISQREVLEWETRLTDQEVSNILADLYDSGKAKPVRGLWYLVA